MVNEIKWEDEFVLIVKNQQPITIKGKDNIKPFIDSNNLVKRDLIKIKQVGYVIVPSKTYREISV